MSCRAGFRQGPFQLQSPSTSGNRAITPVGATAVIARALVIRRKRIPVARFYGGCSSCIRGGGGTSGVRRLKPVEGAGGLPPCGSRAVLPCERDRPVAASDLAGQADLPYLPGTAD